MKLSWLIQRLNAPTSWINPLAFGGGLKNGGFSDEVMVVFNSIFSFDYMGSAEFEFGDVPKAFKKMYVERNEYTSFIIERVAGKEKSVYVICNKEDKEEVTERICNFALNTINRTKEMVGLKEAVEGLDFYSRLRGWVEINNGYMFFIDKDMFEKMKSLILEG